MARAWRPGTDREGRGISHWKRETVAAAAIVMLVLVPSPSAPSGPPRLCDLANAGLVANPLRNAGFEAGMPVTLTTDGALGEGVGTAGSLLPGATEPNAKIVTPPWTVTIFRADRLPHSTPSWVLNAGIGSGAALLIRYDSRDSGREALVLQQAIAPPLTGGAFCGASEVRATLMTTKAVLLMAQVWTAERPFLPFTSPLVAIAPEETTTFTLPLEAGAGSLTRFQLLLSDAGNASSNGAHVWLDDVHLFGSRVPVPDPPV